MLEKTYTTPAEVIRDCTSVQPGKSNAARKVLRAGSGHLYGGRVFAALTFEGVRYVAVRKRTKSGEWSKRFKTQTLESYLEDLKGHGIPDWMLESDRRKFAA